MIRSENITEVFLLSMAKNCEMLIEQTHRKSNENWNLIFSNQEKHFLSIHLYRLKDLG